MNIDCKNCKNRIGEYNYKIHVKYPFEDNKIIDIDPCIYIELLFLWNKGIKTLGSCCGHGEVDTWICVDDDSIDIMKSMGYRNHKNLFFPDSENHFYSKSLFNNYKIYGGKE